MKTLALTQLRASLSSHSAPAPAAHPCVRDPPAAMGTQTRLGFLPGNQGCSTGRPLGWIPVVEFLGDGGVGCLYQQRGCSAAAPDTQPGVGGEEGMGGGSPSPAPGRCCTQATPSLLLQRLELWDPSLIISLLAENEPPQQLFLSNLGLKHSQETQDAQASLSHFAGFFLMWRTVARENTTIP